MTDQRNIPPENGRKAHVLKTGEAAGSGSGAGGGNPGEEFDTDEQGTDQLAPAPAAKGAPGQGAGDR